MDQTDFLSVGIQKIFDCLLLVTIREIFLLDGQYFEFLIIYKDLFYDRGSTTVWIEYFTASYGIDKKLELWD